jgi:hypothetical protein
MCAPYGAAHAATEQQSLEELRGTVVNLLQALVDQGVITREKAAALVKQAQDKAATDAAAVAEAEEGAIRVPYVPQIVKDEISKQVAAEVRPGVVSDVVKEAKAEGWGIPASLPEWLSRVRVLGDVVVRAQEDTYGHGNAVNAYPDYQSINAAGGNTKAGTNEYLNTTDDRFRLRFRARFGLEATLSDAFSAGVRLSTGSLTDPSSASQNAGAEFARYTAGFDQAWIRWDYNTASRFSIASVTSGRIPNPWFAPTELVWARDVNFDGVAVTGRLGIGDGSADQSHFFATAGGFPVQEQPLVYENDKWLVGAQLGSFIRWEGGPQLKIAGAYYDFIRAEGVRNSFLSTLTNYTAPPFIRFGNTYFQISNTTDSTVNLYGLAARFRVADLAASFELPVGDAHRLTLNAEAARNVGFSTADVLVRTGATVAPRANGYVADLRFGDGTVSHLGDWRAVVGYRYVERDAVIDSLTDADFHTGGTNVKGYYLWGELGLAKDVWMRLRYMAGSIIDGPQFNLDVLQLDLNARF